MIEMKPEKLRGVVLDFDGTMVPSGEIICDMYNVEYANHPDFAEAKFENCMEYYMKDVCPLLTLDKMAEFFGSSEFFERAYLYNGVKDFIETVQRLGLNVFISSFGNVPNITKKVPYLNEINDELIYKNTIAPWGVKIEKDWNMEGCVFVDDKTSNLDESNATYKVLYDNDGCFERDWNIDHTGKGYTLACDYSVIMRMVINILAEEANLTIDTVN